MRAVVLYAFGLKQPKEWTARVPSGVFEGVTVCEQLVFERKRKNALRAHIPDIEAAERNWSIYSGKIM